MKSVRTITTAVLFFGLAGSAFAYPAQGNSNKHKNHGDKHEDKGDKHEDKDKGDKQEDKQEHAKKHGEAKHGPTSQTHPVAQTPANRPSGWDKGKKTGWNGGS